MNILGVIPARYASTRFPGKPLVDICGKSMIQRVYEQAKKASSLSEVIVATDDERIADHVKSFGGKICMTSAEHPSGTDRCAEVLQYYPETDVVINIQGDEPFIDPKQIELLAACFSNTSVSIATLIKKINSPAVLFNPNSPKVVLNSKSDVLYFSRSAIPHLRGKEENEWLQLHTYFQHIGIYGYKASTLKEITKLPASLLEKAESLEQLRWLENGYSIRAAETTLETIAIDTPEDLEKAILFAKE